MKSSNSGPSGAATEFRLCDVVVDGENGMDAENLDERKCPNEAVGKFRFETTATPMTGWLCEDHSDDYDIIDTIETIDTNEGVVVDD